MNSTRSEENLQSCKVVESPNRRDGDDPSEDRDNRKVGSDTGLELQIWTGSVKAGEAGQENVRREFVELAIRP